MIDDQLNALCAELQGIIFDVDGVLTDGRITYSDDGHELKSFHVQDGASLKLLQQYLPIAVITGRRSPMVARRTRELGIQFVMQGAESKVTALQQLQDAGFPDAALAAVGDDLQDLQLFEHAAVSLNISVPNGHPATREHAHWITQRAGGDGVVAEITETILKSRGQWPF